MEPYKAEWTKTRLHFSLSWDFMRVHQWLRHIQTCLQACLWIWLSFLDNCSWHGVLLTCMHKQVVQWKHVLVCKGRNGFAVWLTHLHNFKSGYQQPAPLKQKYIVLSWWQPGLEGICKPITHCTTWGSQQQHIAANQNTWRQQWSPDRIMSRLLLTKCKTLGSESGIG